MTNYNISKERLTIAQVGEIMRSETQLQLSEACTNAIEHCRNYLDNRLKDSNEAIYGINTGFGSLCNTIISKENLGTLQRNLVISHAAGMGDKVPQNIVKLMLFLKAKGLSQGHSAAQLVTVQRLLDFYNKNLLPVVYTQGSLGASGDLAPLAHLSLPLLGEGEFYQAGKIAAAQTVLQENNLTKIDLQSKEGLALLNGTQFMSAYGTFLVLESQRLLEWADLIGALSLEAYDGRPEPFTPQVHAIRHHKGQQTVAENIRGYLKGSELIGRAKSHVQDPYSFRCMPQVHGASRDTLKYIAGVVEDEINAVTDNPTVFPDDDLIVSAGNFHGQPLALALDQLAIAMAEIGSISERRTYKLVGGTRELPAFLAPNPGLNSGFMIPQYTAASIVSQNKQYCTPASIDTIDSSNGQEDHVSMGANAATKAYKVVDNTTRVLAIELLNAAQALHFRRPTKTSPKLERLVAQFRKEIPFIAKDDYMSVHMRKAEEFMRRVDPLEV